MAINFNNALGTYEAALKLRTQRAEILSANLANADTPNYKARDIDFHKALQSQLTMQRESSITSTQSGHDQSAWKTMSGPELLYRTPSQPSIDGNTVDENIEHAEFMSNSMEFQVAFTLLNSRFRGLMSAIKGD